MAEPPAVTGRGAWTKRGGTTPNFELTVPNQGEPFVRKQTTETDYKDVWYGVRELQRALNRRGTWPPPDAATVLPLDPDGWFGKRTAEAVRQFKVRNGRPNSNKVGPVTARVLFASDVELAARRHGLPIGVLCGFCFSESTHDPAARGFLTPSDCGVCQLNTVSHAAEFSEAQAFEVQYALDYTARRTADAGRAYDRLTGPKKISRLTYQIAQHNWPVGANQWLRTGTPPINPVNGRSLATYVATVETGCQ